MTSIRVSSVSAFARDTPAAD